MAREETEKCSLCHGTGRDLFLTYNEYGEHISNTSILPKCGRCKGSGYVVIRTKAEVELREHQAAIEAARKKKQSEESEKKKREQAEIAAKKKQHAEPERRKNASRARAAMDETSTRRVNPRWSGKFASVGAVATAICILWAHPPSAFPPEQTLTMAAFASLLVGTLVGRFYRIIVLAFKAAFILLLFLIIVGAYLAITDKPSIRPRNESRPPVRSTGDGRSLPDFLTSVTAIEMSA